MNKPLRLVLLGGLLVALLASNGCQRQPATSPGPALDQPGAKTSAKVNAAEEQPADQPTADEPTTDQPSADAPRAESMDATGSETEATRSSAPTAENAAADIAQGMNASGNVANHEAASDDGLQSSKATPLASEEARAAGPSPSRLLLPTTAGPLLVDLEIRVGEQSLNDAYQQQLEAIIEEVAGDAPLTWNNLLDHVRANPQQFGRFTIEPSQDRQLVERYDRNRNKQPDLEEVASLIFRDSGFSEPFRLTGSDVYRHVNRTRSPVFLALDRDGNQQLDSEEIRLAETSLAKLDRDGDRRIDWSEVSTTASFDASNQDPWQRRNSSRWGDVAMDLDGYVDWSMLAYSFDATKRPGIFDQRPPLVSRLDANADQSIDADESRRLLEVPADLRLRIRFDFQLSNTPTLDVEITEPDPEVTIETFHHPQQIRIRSQRFQLIVTARDLPTGADSIPAEAFAALDTDQDGGLDETEIPDTALRELSFEQLDRDRDGKLTLREWNEGRRGETPPWTVQVRGRGAEAPDAVFAWLDQDNNGFLSARERVRSSHYLKQLANEKGNLEAIDLPDTFLLQLGRGEPGQDAQLFAPAPPFPATSSSWPLWAQSMDANQDGDIAAAEFLGSAEQFRQLDRDEDGFLDDAEIESAIEAEK